MNGGRLATTDDIVCLYTDDSQDALDELAEWVDTHDVRATLVPIDEKVSQDDYERASTTLGITVGGDGAFLAGVREFASRGIPILGVNTGSLAFLARISPSELQDALTEITSGHATVADRQQVALESDSLSATGVNDVMIQPVPPENPVDRKITTLHTYIDNEYVGEYTGSGLAVATPTGSTGISLSAEGPIHYPTNNLSLQITPLHTHKMGVRPVIVSSDSEVTVVPEDDVHVLVDGGRHYTTASAGEPLDIIGAANRAHIVRTDADDQFFKALAKKLGWGLRSTEPRVQNQTTTTQSQDLLDKARDVAIEAARSAGEPLRELHGQVEGVEYKTDKSDIVTEADYQSDEIITAILESSFPEHTVLTEETWPDQVEELNEFTWVVDPLDGTGNFTHGNPNYCVSIALLKNGTPFVGVVYQPETDELFSAIKDRGAQVDRKKICVTDRTQLDESMVLSGYDPNGDFIEEFYKNTRGVRAIGSSALNLCYVAAGTADAAWEYDTHPWDVAAGLLILRESGGIATGVDGDTYEVSITDMRGNPLIASNRGIHDAIQTKIQKSGIRTTSSEP